LLQRNAHLKLWSAGSSYGAEAYSLAILLHELAPNRGHQILGTDIDQEVLERARRGVFGESDLRNAPAEYKQRYFHTIQENGRTLYEADPVLKRYLKFERHNLLSDPYPKGFHLIACRNVVIYFSDEAKERIFREFHNALVPGGYLFVGNTERIFTYAQIGFENPSAFFYKKPTQEVQRWRNAS
jgi:chemotaxis protein methyltransferase CheR